MPSSNRMRPMVWPSGISTSTASTIRANGRKRAFATCLPALACQALTFKLNKDVPVADLEVHIQTQADESRLVTCRPRTATGEALLKDAIP